MATKRLQTVHITSKVTVSLDYVDPKGEVGYPGDWFAKHPGEKPQADIPKYKGNYDALVNSVKGGIRSESLTLKTVKVFLHAYGKTLKGTLEQEWISFKMKIGIAGSEITPWDIITIRETTEYVPTEAVCTAPARTAGGGIDEVQDWTDKAMVLYILCIYRLTKVTNEDYADSLQKRMEDQVKAEGGKGMSFHGARSTYRSWISDRDFLKLVAAYDMFFNRYIDHPAAVVRMGSLGSRFRDCAGLLSFGFALSILNIESGDLMDWVFLKAMGDEVSRITKASQETGDPFSYFPYQSDLGLVRRSAYSSNANPYLFTWIHMIGSILGHKRSKNARLIFEGNFVDVVTNAVLVSWVYARKGKLISESAPDGANYGDDIEGPDGGEAEEEGYSPEDRIWIETQGREPKTWFAILKNAGFIFPAIVRRAIQKQREKILDVKEDTVGEYVKSKIIFKNHNPTLAVR